MALSDLELSNIFELSESKLLEYDEHEVNAQ
jgi:hypothetical protein